MLSWLTLEMPTSDKPSQTSNTELHKLYPRFECPNRRLVELFIVCFCLVLLQCLLSLLYLSNTDVFVLINYTAFSEAMFIMLSVGGLLWLRYREPNLQRPIKVSCCCCCRLRQFVSTIRKLKTIQNVFEYAVVER